jgi:hypothetical protein
MHDITKSQTSLGADEWVMSFLKIPGLPACWLVSLQVVEEAVLTVIDSLVAESGSDYPSTTRAMGNFLKEGNGALVLWSPFSETHNTSPGALHRFGNWRSRLNKSGP